MYLLVEHVDPADAEPGREGGEAGLRHGQHHVGVVIRHEAAVLLPIALHRLRVQQHQPPHVHEALPITCKSI